METMEITQFNNCYSGKKVLVTGHTGFKGSWLTLWLKSLGAQVSGIGLDPETSPNHWDSLDININDFRFDIRDENRLKHTINKIQPDIVFHLAAQPLVRRSYSNPLESWSTNVMGTANLLESCRQCGSIQAILIITTDKVYENREWAWGYREIERLGGRDPYSASKSACEMVVNSYRLSFFNQPNSPLLASARAGNVIGGGDWCEDRLIPDIIRATIHNSSVIIRAPKSTRPWQHVLDCLSGYLILGERLLKRDYAFAEAWNFGPKPDDNVSVEKILKLMQQHWHKVTWDINTDNSQPHEASQLYLDSSKAHTKLQWKPTWSLEKATKMTTMWYREFINEIHISSEEQLSIYVQDAAASNLRWATSV